VDKHYRTNIEGIYAIGDVIAGPMLAHKAEDEGIALRRNIAGKAGHVNYEAIAGIIYTNPELAGVGLTEDQAKDKGSTFVSAGFRSAPTAAHSARRRRWNGQVCGGREDRSHSRRAHIATCRFGINRRSRLSD
jgi:pyruvate/2-oxoglutarate dehydrogenase complex dihydrolipoamide dehydrogenase (E3) component